MLWGYFGGISGSVWGCFGGYVCGTLGGFQRVNRKEKERNNNL